MQPLHTLCRRIGNFVLLFGAMPDLHYINGPDTLPPAADPAGRTAGAVRSCCGRRGGAGCLDHT